MPCAIHLDDMLAFYRVAEQKGISAAARHYRISKQTLSRRIVFLESCLGATLIARNTRHFELTRAGQSYFNDCEKIIAHAQEANLRLQEYQQCASILRLQLPSELHSASVMAFLFDYQRQHPSLRLELTEALTAEDLDDAHVDVFLRLGPLENSDRVAKSIGFATFVLVGKPGIDMSLQPTIQVEGAVFKHLQTTTPAPSLRVANCRLALQAVLAGFGSCYLPLGMCQEFLHSGQLKCMENQQPARSLPVYMVFFKDRHLPASTRGFIAAFAQFCQSPPWDCSATAQRPVKPARALSLAQT
jgi:DNA-binding transcriptional LysR family regulator